MTKKEQILVLFGSPNPQGFTKSLLKIYLENYKLHLHNEAEIEYHSLYHHNYLPCTGCNRCAENGVCVLNQKDGYDKLLHKIERSNLIVLAAPVYFIGFPAPMKAMIDRMQQRYVKKFGHGKKEENKHLRRGALVATCGSDTTKFFRPLDDSTKMFFDCMDISFVDKLFASNTDHPSQIKITDI